MNIDEVLARLRRDHWADKTATDAAEAIESLRADSARLDHMEAHCRRNATVMMSGGATDEGHAYVVAGNARYNLREMLDTLMAHERGRLS